MIIYNPFFFYLLVPEQGDLNPNPGRVLEPNTADTGQRQVQPAQVNS